MSRKKARKLLLILFALVFLVTLLVVGRRLWDYHRGEQAYSEAEQLVNLPDLDSVPLPNAPAASAAPSPAGPAESAPPADASASPSPGSDHPPQQEQPVYVDPYADLFASMDFTALREVNDDVIGWITIPGTPVCYPLLQGDDNEYYLDHMWHRGIGSVGSIFMECQNDPGLSDFHTLIYGHRMINGSMFSALKNYKDLSYWQSAPCVYITTDAGTFRYDIFASYEAAVDSPTYQIFFSGYGGMQDFIDSCVERSVLSTGIVPTPDDFILTLSTCTGAGYDTRWVVQAVLREAPAAFDSVPAGG